MRTVFPLVGSIAFNVSPSWIYMSAVITDPGHIRDIRKNGRIRGRFLLLSVS